MRQLKLLGAALGVALLVAACGGGGEVALPARGQLIQNSAQRTTSLTAADLTASLQATSTGQSLLQLTGAPACGVDIQHFRYGTVGGAGETTDASGALMVPTGTGPTCTGARPIVLYGHGTNISKRYNLADFAAKSDGSHNPAYDEAVVLAAMYAAQGYIVVAPNYAGYDSSSLSYHPYVNADQQSKDMIDALAAAKSALPTLVSRPVASSKLFVAGYSQGGHVAMATVRAMQALQPPIPVTASVPMSGPYALSAYTDFIFMGGVPIGSTAFAPLLTASFQKSYGGIYSSPADIYEAAYATGIESLVPGSYDFTTVYSSQKLPQTALFSNVTTDAPVLAAMTPLVTGTSSDALFAIGVGTPNLIRNSARSSFIADAVAHGFDAALPSALTGRPQTLQLATGVTHPLRAAAQRNDLRAGWAGPTSPMLMCGGHGDPTVFFDINTSVMSTVWGANPKVSTLDVDPTGASAVPNAVYGGVQTAFGLALSGTAAAAGSDPVAQTTAVTAAYHGTLVLPFCNAAARGFFSTF